MTIFTFWLLIGSLLSLFGLKYILSCILAFNKSEFKFFGKALYMNAWPVIYIIRKNANIDKPITKRVENKKRFRYFYWTEIIELNPKDYKNKAKSLIMGGFTLLIIGVALIYFFR